MLKQAMERLFAVRREIETLNLRMSPHEMPWLRDDGVVGVSNLCMIPK